MNNNVPRVYACTFNKLISDFNKKYYTDSYSEEEYIPATHYDGYPFSKGVLFIEKVMLNSPYKVLLTDEQRILFKTFVDDYVEIVDCISEKLNYNDSLLWQDDICLKVEEEMTKKLLEYDSYNKINELYIKTMNIYHRYTVLYDVSARVLLLSYNMHHLFEVLYKNNRKAKQSSPETDALKKMKLLKKLFVDHGLTVEPCLDKYEAWIAADKAGDYDYEYENRYTKMKIYTEDYLKHIENGKLYY